MTLCCGVWCGIVVCGVVCVQQSSFPGHAAKQACVLCYHSRRSLYHSFHSSATLSHTFYFTSYSNNNLNNIRPDRDALLKSIHDVVEAAGVVKEGWNGYNVIHDNASRVAALDIGFAPR